MRVGVVTGELSPSPGGGYALRKSIYDALVVAESRHEFIVLDQAIAADKPRGETVRPSALLAQAARRIGSRLIPAAVKQRLRRLIGPPAKEEPVSRLEQEIQTRKIDLVWFLFPAGATHAAPYFTTVWDLQHRLQPWFPEVNSTGWTWEQREKSYRNALPRAARVICGTNVGRDEAVRFYGVAPENVVVVPFPVMWSLRQYERVPDARIRDKFGIKGDYIFYPAQFWPHKNHVNLLIAAERLRREQELDLRVVFVGSDTGNQAHVVETAARLGLTENLRFLGFVSEDDLVALYRGARALVFPSFFGPDNLPPLEAFLLGCPVVAARVAGAQEQLGDAALLFDPGKPDEIADAVARICLDSGLRADLIQKGHERVKTRTPEAYIKQILRTLDAFENVRRCWGHDYSHT